MFHFTCKTLIQNGIFNSKTSYVRYIQTIPFLNSVSNSNPTEKQSLTVSYLMNSCGLSLERAISASKVVNIEYTDKPDSLLKLLNSYGFSKAHIASLISKHPRLILAHPEKTIRPKIEYFKSLGIRGPDLPKLISSNVLILLSSLEKQIIPTFDFVKGIIVTNENLIYALKQSIYVVQCNVEKVMVPNISTLRAHGVPEQNVANLLMMQPKSLMLKPDLFREVVCAIKEMGFEPMRRSFILAVRSMSIISKVNWEKKKEVLRSFGWSETDFILAFRVQPMIMICSVKKIGDVLEFLTTKAGLRPSDVARCPNLFLTSLEKRMIPRCAVLQVLMSQGLVSKNINLVWQLNHSKQIFDKKFLTPFMEEAPAVIEAYQGKIGFQGFSD
ncbi:transcription termination factor MTERF6, chloroplastic/mitochondrial-like [Fagus crenata]